ncbi:hypothetical protein [Pedobacter sp. BMA]|uniref:hypothetical protein n=1 Tax=Pedobacter sp. BMA TaxID=1663685 RepID=UPI0012E013AB|nr:hypothetical protein [Pedobacter sp. BMA]
MKTYIIFLIAFSLLLGCKQKNDKKITAADSLVQGKQKIIANSPRLILITELGKFRDAIAKKDKEQILSFFTFPLADTAVNFFEVDSLFDKQRQEHHGAITRNMFLKSFGSIYTLTEMDEFNNLFKAVDLKELKVKDEISKEVHAKNEGCYFIYSITVRGNEVTLQYGTNTDAEYLKAHPDEGEVCGEYAAIWIFKFDGKNIRFLKHQIAG